MKLIKFATLIKLFMIVLGTILFFSCVSSLKRTPALQSITEPPLIVPHLDAPVMYPSTTEMPNISEVHPINAPSMHPFTTEMPNISDVPQLIAEKKDRRRKMEVQELNALAFNETFKSFSAGARFPPEMRSVLLLYYKELLSSNDQPLATLDYIAKFQNLMKNFLDDYFNSLKNVKEKEKYREWKLAIEKFLILEESYVYGQDTISYDSREVGIKKFLPTYLIGLIKNYDKAKELMPMRQEIIDQCREELKTFCLLIAFNPIHSEWDSPFTAKCREIYNNLSNTDFTTETSTSFSNEIDQEADYK